MVLVKDSCVLHIPSSCPTVSTSHVSGNWEFSHGPEREGKRMEDGGKEEEANKRGGRGSVWMHQERAVAQLSQREAVRNSRGMYYKIQMLQPPNIHPTPPSLSLLYITLEMDYIVSKELQHSSIALVFSPSVVPLSFPG